MSPRKKKITLMLAEDHPIARNGFPALFEDQDEFEIIGLAENGLHLLEMLQSKQPDIIFMDIEMPKMNGIKATEIIYEEYPGIKVIALSMFYTEAFVKELKNRGASAYLKKDSDLETLYETIRQVYASPRPEIKKRADNKFSEKLNQVKLTKREIEILKLLCENKSYSEIADILEISENTVDFHRKALFFKSGADSKSGLVKFAIREGFTGFN